MQWGSYVRNSRNSSQRVGVTEPHILGGTGMVHDLCFRTASSFHFWNIFQCLFIRNFILPMIGKFAIRYNKNAFSMTVKEKKNSSKSEAKQSMFNTKSFDYNFFYILQFECQHMSNSNYTITFISCFVG